MIRYCLLALVCFAYTINAGAAERPESWARPMAATQLQNFYQVSPYLYRSAQPYLDGFQELQQHGIGEVLDLRLYHKDVPAPEMALTLHNVPLLASNLNTDSVVQALNTITHAEKPILVHCLHGADRTGVVVALYRSVCQGWSKEQAIAEMQQGDFGYHSVFNNIPNFIQNADIDAIRAQVQSPTCPLH